MHRYRRIFVKIIMAFSLVVVTLCSCSKDEPRNTIDIEKPSGPRDDQTENDSSDTNDSESDERDDEISIPLIGVWKNESGDIQFRFEADSSFSAVVNESMGFKNDSTNEIAGTYTYQELTRWLWLYVESSTEVYVKEYRCQFEADALTLYPMTGKAIILYKN